MILHINAWTAADKNVVSEYEAWIVTLERLGFKQEWSD